MTNVTMLAHNRPKLTRQALESLARSLSSPDEITLTILHDANDDEMLDVIFRCSLLFKEAHLVLVKEPMGTGGLRNWVIQSSREAFPDGRYLYLSDNDTWHHPKWHETLVQAYEAAWRHGFQALGAYNHPFMQPVETFNLWGGWQVRSVQALATQSMLMRWEVWDEFGPFVDTPAGMVCQSEDVAFSNKIREAGYRVGVISPAMVVNTGVTNSFGQAIPGAELVRREAPQGVVIE